MKKIYIFVQKKDTLPALKALQNLGMVHIEHQEAVQGDAVNRVKDDTVLLQQSLDILKGFEHEIKQEPCLSGLEKPKEIVGLHNEITRHKENVSKWQSLIDVWKSWGDFDPRDFHALAQKGVYLYLCQLSPVEVKKLPPSAVVIILETTKSFIRCLIASKENLNLSHLSLGLPPLSVGQMTSEQDQERIKMQENERLLRENYRFLESLKKAWEVSREHLKFEEITAGMKKEEGIALLKGYIPQENVEQILKTTQTEHWGVLLEDPSEADHPPTLLKNPKWIEIIKPVFDFMNAVPGYKELDVSVLFLLFLSVFFGILIGDAGYGLLFIILTMVFHKRLGGKLSNHAPFFLIYTMSCFAIVWGALTGTFLGTKLFGAYIKPMVPWLTENKNVQLVCFILGVTHLTLAHLWKAINRINSVLALAEIGWILVVWGCFFFTRMLILGEPLPKFINIILILGPGLVILFNQPRKNILAGMGLGLGDFLLNVMSFFGDTVSYIRLFAVGLAGVSVADAFNQMALSAGFNSFISGILAVFVLLVGHALNMVLACFGVLVHGVRLNLLEFSSHLGMEWSGVEYDPLRKKSDQLMKGE